MNIKFSQKSGGINSTVTHRHLVAGLVAITIIAVYVVVLDLALVYDLDLLDLFSTLRFNYGQNECMTNEWIFDEEWIVGRMVDDGLMKIHRIKSALISGLDCRQHSD